LTALQVLNRSAIVLLTACWEAFVEDLATSSFEWLLAECKDAQAFPNRVRARASKALRDDKNELAVWDLAGDGWKAVLRRHKAETIVNAVGTFNTPKSAQVDALYEQLLGLPHLSTSWRWPSMPVERVRRKLDRLIEIRGNIAHRVRDTRPVRRPEVDYLVDFVNRLATLSHNAVVTHLTAVAQHSPWLTHAYRRVDQRSALQRRRSTS